jgi:hypothetical protein
MEDDAHPGPDADCVVPPRWDEIVEGSVERRDVWTDLYDPRGRFGQAQIPSARLRSSTLGVASQLNSLSERPKCP